MNLSAFLDMRWDDEAMRLAFLHAHDQEHHLLNEASTDQHLAGLMYPLGDIGDIEVWKEQHAYMHEQLATNIGIAAPPDLRDWDFDEEGQFEDFQQDHLADHTRLAAAYGVLI